MVRRKELLRQVAAWVIFAAVIIFVIVLTSGSSRADTWTSDTGSASLRATMFVEGAADSAGDPEAIYWFRFEAASAFQRVTIVDFEDWETSVSGATITSATLRLYNDASGSATSADTARVELLSEDWVESEATWNSRSSGVSWTTGGGSVVAGVDSRPVAVTDFSVTWQDTLDLDVTDLVQEVATNGTTQYGFRLSWWEEDGDAYARVASDETATAIRRPRLEIVYTPAPVAPSGSEGSALGIAGGAVSGSFVGNGKGLVNGGLAGGN